MKIQNKRRRKKAPKDYCLTCRVPMSKCKGNCTQAQMKANGG